MDAIDAYHKGPAAAGGRRPYHVAAPASRAEQGDTIVQPHFSLAGRRPRGSPTTRIFAHDGFWRGGRSLRSGACRPSGRGGLLENATACWSCFSLGRRRLPDSCWRFRNPSIRSPILAFSCHYTACVCSPLVVRRRMGWSSGTLSACVTSPCLWGRQHRRARLGWFPASPPYRVWYCTRNASKVRSDLHQRMYLCS